MTDSSKRWQEIKYLFEKYNISVGKLSVVSSIPRAKIYSTLNSPKQKVSLKVYDALKPAIHKIVNGKVSKSDLFEPAEFFVPKLNNINEIRNFLDENNLSHGRAKEILGLTKYQFARIVSKSKRNDISDEKKNEILSKLKEAINK